MGRGQPDDIIIFQIWNTAKFGNSKLEKLILYVFAEIRFLDLGVIFSLVIYVTITFMLSKLEFDLKLKPEYLILQIIYFQLSA